MGLFLRKKSSKASLKGKKDDTRAPTPPPQLPPLPDHIRRAEAAAQLNSTSNATSSAADPSPKALRRRSRSMWAIGSEAKASAPPARIRRDSFGGGGGMGGGSADIASQPWRSHDAWMAFQNPQPSPTVLDELVFPCSNGGSIPGWRGRGGGGLFSTEGITDTETIRRAATPAAFRCMTPGGTRSESPALGTQRLSPTPSPPAVESLRSDFSSPTPGSVSSGTRETVASGPMPTTPRARAGSLSAAEQPTPQAIPSHLNDYAQTPETPGEMLLTPQSTYLASGSNGTPSPLANSGWVATTPGTPSRPTRRPPAPPASTESDDDFQSVQSVPPTPETEESEVIDFTRPPPPPQAFKQNASRNRSGSSPAPLSPSMRTGQLPEMDQQQVRAGVPRQWTTNADGFYQPSRATAQQAYAPTHDAVHQPPPVASAEYPESYQQTQPLQSPASFASASMSPTADGGAFQAPLRLPAHPTLSAPLASAPLASPALSTHSTMLPYAQPSTSQLSLAASTAPSRSAPQPPMQDVRPVPPSRTASGSSHGHGGSHHGHGARPPSRGAASSNSHRVTGGTGGTGSRPPSRGPSSNGHGYQSDAAVPHTPDAIERAVSVWRQKGRKTRSGGGVDGDVPPPSATASKFSFRKQSHPDAYPASDVFAPTGAYEAAGTYNPYDAAEFDHPPASFSPPMRLPQVMPAHGAMPSPAKSVSSRRPGTSTGIVGSGSAPRRPSRSGAQPAWI